MARKTNPLFLALVLAGAASTVCVRTAAASWPFNAPATQADVLDALDAAQKAFEHVASTTNGAIDRAVTQAVASMKLLKKRHASASAITAVYNRATKQLAQLVKASSPALNRAEGTAMIHVLNAGGDPDDLSTMFGYDQDASDSIAAERADQQAALDQALADALSSK